MQFRRFYILKDLWLKTIPKLFNGIVIWKKYFFLKTQVKNQQNGQIIYLLGLLPSSMSVWNEYNIVPFWEFVFEDEQKMQVWTLSKSLKDVENKFPVRHGRTVECQWAATMKITELSLYLRIYRSSLVFCACAVVFAFYVYLASLKNN